MKFNAGDGIDLELRKDLLGASLVEEGSGSVVDGGLKAGQIVIGEGGQVQILGKVSADDAFGVLVGAVLPGFAARRPSAESSGAMRTRTTAGIGLRRRSATPGRGGAAADGEATGTTPGTRRRCPALQTPHFRPVRNVAFPAAAASGSARSDDPRRRGRCAIQTSEERIG